ncbi:hypothetical protein B0H13DRAFT_1867133 [Mycena leptocephala]|nr:hypothetical protein B0H13DRAFT_1867133 [Mycena leptocephala]
MNGNSTCLDFCDPQTNPNGKALKATVPGEGKHHQEVIFTVVDALKKLNDISANRVKYARQYSIVGYKNTEFKDSQSRVGGGVYVNDFRLPEPWTLNMEDEVY